MALSVIRVLLVGLLLVGGCAPRGAPEGPAPEPFRVLTLNLHHGIGTDEQEDGSNVAAFRRNLDAVAAVLKRESVDIAAFQEADGPSDSSGGFDHIDAVIEASGLENANHGFHCNRETTDGAIRYGTALVSRLPLSHEGGGTFPGAPAEYKGYVVATVRWEGRELDVVSVHFHERFSAMRMDQARALAREMGRRRRPLVIMGDMNCAWNDSEKTLRILAEQLGLTAFEPDDKRIITSLTDEMGRRLDWVLVSKELEIRSQRVLPDRLAERLAVVAEIAWRERPKPKLKPSAR
jgi:endonuclease/exonuclease/phosphatase family metal-dependent hydrolase